MSWSENRLCVLCGSPFISSPETPYGPCIHQISRVMSAVPGYTALSPTSPHLEAYLLEELLCPPCVLYLALCVTSWEETGSVPEEDFDLLQNCVEEGLPKVGDMESFYEGDKQVPWQWREVAIFRDNLLKLVTELRPMPKLTPAVVEGPRLRPRRKRSPPPPPPPATQKVTLVKKDRKRKAPPSSEASCVADQSDPQGEGKRRYNCALCGVHFTRHDNRDRHLRRLHKQEMAVLAGKD